MQPRGKRLDQAGLVGMGERPRRPVERAPCDGADFRAVGRGELTADRCHQPELGLLGDRCPVAQNVVRDGAQLLEHLADKTGLLAHLAQCRPKGRLAVLDPALRKAPGTVWMAGRLHGRHTQQSVDYRQHDAACPMLDRARCSFGRQ